MVMTSLIQTLTFQTTCPFLPASIFLTNHLKVSSFNKSMLLHLSSAGTALVYRLSMNSPDITLSQSYRVLTTITQQLDNGIAIDYGNAIDRVHDD